MGLFRRRAKNTPPPAAQPADPPSDGDLVDPDERSPQLGIKFKDLAVLGSLVNAGADLDQPREVTYYLYARTEQFARELGDAVRPHGYTIELRPPMPDNPKSWPVICTTIAAVKPDWVRAATDFFERMAAEHHADFDGWETAL